MDKTNTRQGEQPNILIIEITKNSSIKIDENMVCCNFLALHLEKDEKIKRYFINICTHTNKCNKNNYPEKRMYKSKRNLLIPYHSSTLI